MVDITQSMYRWYTRFTRNGRTSVPDFMDDLPAEHPLQNAVRRLNESGSRFLDAELDSRTYRLYAFGGIEDLGENL